MCCYVFHRTIIALPKPTKELYRVFVIKITGLEDFDTYKFLAYIFNVIEIRIQHDITLGDVFIIDYTHLKMGHVLKMTPIHVKKAGTVFEVSSKFPESHTTYDNQKKTKQTFVSCWMLFLLKLSNCSCIHSFISSCKLFILSQQRNFVVIC